MTEIEKIKRYIERTKMPETKRYSMNIIETLELARSTRGEDSNGIEAVVIAFEYGKAKGYRAAKAEVTV